MGHLLKIKCGESRVNVHILATTSISFTRTTVQVPNLALTHTKRITVYLLYVTNTVIRFVSNSAKFSICTVVGLNGTLFEARVRKFQCPKSVFLASTSVPFRPITM
jgi:hypothetical protein